MAFTDLEDLNAHQYTVRSALAFFPRPSADHQLAHELEHVGYGSALHMPPVLRPISLTRSPVLG
jgi:hypothetical protein